MPETATQVAVVGAGLAGLTAGGVLTSAGIDVVLADKGRSVGGRLATRRIGEATIDHGAQFFTVRGDSLAAVVDEAIESHLVYEWCRGFGNEPDGYPRYAVRGGMNQLAKHFARGLRLLTNTRVESVRHDGDRWLLTHAAGTIRSRGLLLTAPMPQNLELLRAGGVGLELDLTARLAALTYHPTLALLAAVDGPTAVPDPGGVQLTSGPFTFVADNRMKGISAGYAFTGHVDHGLSAEQWELDDATILDGLLETAAPWLGTANVVDAQLKRWRFAGAVSPSPLEIEFDTVAGLPVVFAGDAFAGAKVEGAFRSGLAAGEFLVNRLASAW